MKLTKKLKNKKIILALAVIVLLAAIPFVYVYGYGGNLLGWTKFHDDEKSAPNVNQPKNEQDAETKRTGNKEHANDNVAGGTGVIDDENATVDVNQPGVSAQSGAITLFTPKDGKKLENGDTIEGAAKVDTIYYRLEDDVRGVIGMGELPVRNGTFSGTLSVNASGKNGTLDIFSFDEQGREINNIRIKVTY